MVRPEVIDEAVPKVRTSSVWYFKKTFTKRSATSDRHPEFCFWSVAFLRPVRRNSLNATGCVHKIHFLERATAHFFSWAHTAHSVAQDKVVSASFIVIPHAHSHPVSLMSLLNVKFTPFPSLLFSPSTSTSMTPTSLPGRTRSWCQSPDAPARWRESGRLVDSAPPVQNDTRKSGRTANVRCNWWSQGFGQACSAWRVMTKAPEQSILADARMVEEGMAKIASCRTCRFVQKKTPIDDAAMWQDSLRTTGWFRWREWEWYTGKWPGVHPKRLKFIRLEDQLFRWLGAQSIRRTNTAEPTILAQRWAACVRLRVFR